MQNAIIKITNLRLRTYIGFNPDEQEKKQDVVLNIEIHYPGDKACLNDNVDDALNYKVITKSIIDHVENGRFLCWKSWCRVYWKLPNPTIGSPSPVSL